MSRTIDFPKGLTFHTNRDKSEFFKQLKKEFKFVHIPFFDCTCADPDGKGGFLPSDTDSLPVRINSETLVLEYFDGNVWLPFDVNEETVDAALTADTGQIQADGTPIESQFSNFTIVATAGDAATLPGAAEGLVRVIKNSGATPLQVFPALGDTIDGAAANASILIAPGAQITFTSLNTTAWISTNTANPSASAINSTGSATAAQVATGLITSTSAAATSITLPSATALATQLSAVRGRKFDLVVDNSVGASTVTMVVNTGITLPSTVVIVGSDTLTVASGNVGVFRFVFTSSTTAKLFRTS